MSEESSRSLLLLLLSHDRVCRLDQSCKQELFYGLSDLVALVGGLVAVATAFVTAKQTAKQQSRQFAEDFRRDRDQYRTQFMAEQVAMQLLLDDAFILRSFDQIKKRLGGFDDDELKKILVRAGAIRFEGLNGKELWGLLSRSEVRKALGSQRLAQEIGVVSEEAPDER